MGNSVDADTVVAHAPAGSVRGRWRHGSAAFLGIPYAEPPIGDRRFAAPEPRARWSGVRDALRQGATPQRTALAAVTAIPEPSIAGDDTLNVNVFTPRPGSLSSDRLLPVMLYIHGGAYIAGSPASPWYDGRSFNRDDVVVVTISYRLGFDGFGWLPDAPSNRGVLDWLLALEWVRDNISAFGGDPANVTIAGQSAGGGAVLTLLTLPRARGLFARAVVMSGVPADIPIDVARQRTEGIAARLGIRATRDAFAALPEEAVLAAQTPSAPGGDPTDDSLIAAVAGIADWRTFGPVVDGELVPWTASEGMRAGEGRDLPLLIGYTREEFNAITRAHRALFDGRDPESLLTQAGVDPAVARLYASVLPEHHPGDVLGQYATDVVYRRRLPEWLDRRRGDNTWVYDFAWRSPVSGIAGHCLDVPFAFDVLDDPDVPRVAGAAAPQIVADSMHGALVEFARDGRPTWPAYAEGESVMLFDDAPRVIERGYDSARVLAGL